LNEKSQTQVANLAAANDDGAPKSQYIDLIQVSLLLYFTIFWYMLYFIKYMLVILTDNPNGQVLKEPLGCGILLIV
jgi:hypothetical protein